MVGEKGVNNVILCEHDHHVNQGWDVLDWRLTPRILKVAESYWERDGDVARHLAVPQGCRTPACWPVSVRF